MKEITYKNIVQLEDMENVDLIETLVNNPDVLVIDNRQITARLKDLEIAVERLEALIGVTE